jgi:hypothetical protein
MAYTANGIREIADGKELELLEVSRRGYEALQADCQPGQTFSLAEQHMLRWLEQTRHPAVKSGHLASTLTR